ncbi:peptidoglycan bridge formation glycyltransferase FemA/FemB family protein [Flavivirga rizhaonensis]|uniref:Peptidoglycan bridge formation glycyltransferase FemA/FemB family protein n=1 Tax=Flavivirga rizhaonensis TaxID=2559571 RepID=A0A4S1E1Y0_9FLAO|nr:peptidoglycan bridge formation glycyltransferase FemA/FemB family protein [Flavivirga rizhaonensis]TGV03922.1 peptidoglycan bridge formation glycyltransferase FemA/FemB family protein [Flavivirga rizhaonensis]
MHIDLQIITSKNEWKKTLAKVSNYDFYHTYVYHKLSKKENEEAILLKYSEDDKLICIPFILRKIKNTEYFDVTSVYGYSGPLHKNINPSFDNTNFIKVLKKYFIDKKIVSVFSRLNPFIKNQDLILKNFGSIVELGSIVNIDLSKPLENQKASFSRTTNRYIAKGNKFLEIKKSNKSNDIESFINLYYKNMDRVKAKKRYYFSKQYFLDFIASDEFKTNIILAICKKTNKIISAALMVETNNIIQYHLSGTDVEYLKISPIRSIINKTMVDGTKDKFTYFNLGGGLGNEQDNLFKFKSSFSTDFKFFKIWKYIVNKEVYESLVNQKDIKIQTDFFPLYREEE